MITQTHNLNLIPGSVPPVVNVTQYDKTARTLVFNLWDGETPRLRSEERSRTAMASSTPLP